MLPLVIKLLTATCRQPSFSKPRAAKKNLPSPRGRGIEVYESSGNIFADLGFEDPEEELRKAKVRSNDLDQKGLS